MIDGTKECPRVPCPVCPPFNSHIAFNFTYFVGVHRKLTTDFMSVRIKSAEKKHLEVNRLEKRIEKLAQIHLQFEPNVTSSPTPSTNSSTFSPISSGTSSIRAKGLFRSVTVSRGQQLKSNVVEREPERWLYSTKLEMKGLISNFFSSLVVSLGSLFIFLAAEQAIVKWEDDATVPGCYICL